MNAERLMDSARVWSLISGGLLLVVPILLWCRRLCGTEGLVAGERLAELSQRLAVKQQHLTLGHHDGDGFVGVADEGRPLAARVQVVVRAARAPGRRR